jgi:hypothetical protein
MDGAIENRAGEGCGEAEADLPDFRLGRDHDACDRLFGVSRAWGAEFRSSPTEGFPTRS